MPTELIPLVRELSPRYDGSPFAICRADEFRRAATYSNQAHRLNFYAFALVNSGDFQHALEQQTRQLRAGSLALVQPNQVHYFDNQADWQGWLLMFRPEFLLPENLREANRNDQILFAEFQQLGGYMQLDAAEQTPLNTLLAELHASQTFPDNELRQALQRHLLYAILSYLLLYKRRRQNTAPQTAAQQRYHQFERLLEAQFTRNHSVADYARQLACTEKSLRQACLAATGQTSKTIIRRRLLLEAKRLLMHSDYTVSQIAHYLGFSETTNFSKFFRQAEGQSAGEFRLRQKSERQSVRED